MFSPMGTPATERARLFDVEDEEVGPSPDTDEGGSRSGRGCWVSCRGVMGGGG